MSGQTPVWKKYTQMTFKMGSRSHNNSQIFASCHLCKLVQNYYKYRNSFNIIRYENNSNQRQQFSCKLQDNANSNDSNHIFVIQENTRLKHRCPCRDSFVSVNTTGPYIRGSGTLGAILKR